ncbi:hypothetical protein [Oceanobacillus alkalisoli]|uniref:hypothetical protein n=1 Tax=Oceanobacillus alkalisoli TaxID=2925113 RepID=UPI001F119B7F|nr:hypothetical protein [Oceanobacillus alkalisoli]MCF3942798.1 hypothetical protein [Oceanobacillus alkalisoli]
MKINWKQVKLPDFSVSDDMPRIPKEIYEARADEFYKQANQKWLVVYGDREHFANLYYLTEFDPRFEEAILILGPDKSRYLLVGNEGLMYKSVMKLDAEVILNQSFSLMGQDRSKSPKLTEILEEIGISKGDSIGVCGWKYAGDKTKEDFVEFYVPAFLIDCMKHVIGGAEGIVDISSVLMHPVEGLRAYNELEQIVAFEWAAARASAALLRIVNSTKEGISEFEAVSNMKYAGEPLTTHVMYASGKNNLAGLRSPSSKIIEKGDAIFTAFGYRGGLSARGGLAETENPQFLDEWAIPYYKGIVAWYESVKVGSIGGEVYKHVFDVLEQGGLQPALNPGHQTSADEWLHSSFRPGSQEKISSGMAIQCDIIPEPMPEGINLNCEDSVVIADAGLREDIANKYPDVWERIKRRQDFMRNELGIQLSDDILPISATPGYYAPLFLSPDFALTKL